MGKSAAQVRREIEETREDLGDTAAALASKTDVRARARDKFDGVKRTIAEKKESFASGDDDGATAQANTAVTNVRTKAQENPIPTAAIAAFVGGFLFGRITRRR